MNSLKKSKKQEASPVAALAAQTDVAARLQLDFHSQVDALFPDEMKDPDAARTLELVFMLGVRLSASRIGESSVKPGLDASTSRVAKLIQEKKAAEGPALSPPHDQTVVMGNIPLAGG